MCYNNRGNKITITLYKGINMAFKYIVEYEDEKAHHQIEGVDFCIKALKELEKNGKIL